MRVLGGSGVWELLSLISSPAFVSTRSGHRMAPFLKADPYAVLMEIRLTLRQLSSSHLQVWRSKWFNQRAKQEHFAGLFPFMSASRLLASSARGENGRFNIASSPRCWQTTC